MSQPASPWTLQASIGGQPCSLDIVGDELVILRSKNEWFRVPLRLVLDAKLDEASTALSLSLLAPRCARFACCRQHILSQERWRHRDTDSKAMSLALFYLYAHLTAGVISGARAWVEVLLDRAYRGAQQFRRILVICNPQGGQGRGRRILNETVHPILRAARCEVTIIETQQRLHAFRAVRELDVSQFDALAIVGGDGTVHELVNGLASRADAERAMRLPIAPVPTGSGNGMAVSLQGAGDNFNVPLACLAAVKGTCHPHELMVVTQAAKHFPALDKTPYVVRGQSQGEEYVQIYSFLSQAIGVMANVDLGTEAYRFLGDVRFTLGYIFSVIKNRPCPITIDVHLGPSGTLDMAHMHRRIGASKPVRRSVDDIRALRFGSVVEQLMPRASLPLNQAAAADSSLPRDWTRLDVNVSSLYIGKLPYVARSLMAFPYAQPNDGLLDVLIQDRNSSALTKIVSTTHGESGRHIFDRDIHYFKVESLRVTPQVPEYEGRRVNFLSIDGERVPYAPFQVEVSPLQLSLLSLDDEIWRTPALISPASSGHASLFT